MLPPKVRQALIVPFPAAGRRRKFDFCRLWREPIAFAHARTSSICGIRTRKALSRFLCSHFLTAVVRTLIAISDRNIRSNDRSQTPLVDHDRDRLVNKIKKSIMIVIDLFTNSKRRSLFTNACDHNQIRSRAKLSVLAVHLTYVYVCKLTFSIKVIQASI